MKTTEELLKLDAAAILKEMEEVKAEKFKTTFGVKNGQDKNTALVGKLKKQFARIKTLIKQKELTK